MSKDMFRIERSARIAAPAAEIAPHIEDFHRWSAWSPFEGDPSLERTFSGAPRGAGAGYAWTGKKAGAGRMEITEARADRVTIGLEFLKPFKAANTAEFRLEPEGEGTRVTWAMFGPVTLVSKVMGVFFDSDRMVGGQFEKGLASLKAVVEGARVAA